MLKRELKVNFKGFILWFIILGLLYAFVLIAYPSIIDQQEMSSLNQLMSVFPKEVLQAFNMDLSTIDTAYGWLKSEGFVMLLIAVGCYSGILGSSILVKEESDKTIEYLNSLPVNRSSILLSKTFSALLYIVLLTVLLAVCNYYALTYNETINVEEFICLSVTPLLAALPLFSINLFLSTFTHKSKRMLGISLGITFISYILQIFSTISKDIEFLKYISVFTLSDLRNVIISGTIDPIMIIISIALTVIMILLSLLHYTYKELV